MKLIFFAVFFLLAGCSSVSRINEIQAPLSISEGVYVPIGLDGYHEGIQQPASAYVVAEQVRSAVQSRMHQVSLGEKAENFDDALTTAKQLRQRYMVYTTILDWKDEATPMASVRDAVQVKIEFINVPTGVVLDAAVLEKRSSIFATEKTGPQQLLAAPLRKYVNSVFDHAADLAEKEQEEPGFFARLWHVYF